MPIDRPAPPSGARARDRAAEIDAAIAAVTGNVGPVSVSVSVSGSVAVGTTAPRTVRFEHATGAPADGWAPFAGALGQLSAEGAVLRAGLGAAQDGLPVEAARAVATAAGARMPAGDVRVVLPEGSSSALVAAVVDGLASGCTGPGPVRLLLPAGRLPAAARGLLAADVVRLARLLVSAPANLLTPERAARWAADIAARTGLGCTVLEPEELRDQGFGALAAIGAGSGNGPRLVRLTRSAPPGSPHLALVGKGITFDSGGLSLKSPAAMQSMRLDVAGAATVLAVMAGLPRVGADVAVTAVLPLAENLPGPGATRPGDVVTAWNGTEVQVLDTDFEGRVVLADGLALAAAAGPDLLVDLATLTYQAEVALGPEIAAVLGRDEAAVARVLDAAATAGEPMWPLPWAERYLGQVRTASGVRNHPLHDSGRALTAALFLGEFVPDDVPWAHCDMTGPAWRGDASGDNATGFGARTLLALVAALSPASGVTPAGAQVAERAQ